MSFTAELTRLGVLDGRKLNTNLSMEKHAQVNKVEKHPLRLEI